MFAQVRGITGRGESESVIQADVFAGQRLDSLPPPTGGRRGESPAATPPPGGVTATASSTVANRRQVTVYPPATEAIMSGAVLAVRA
jgi:hypothetical protein